MEKLHNIFVMSFMTKNPVVLAPGENMVDAYDKMRAHHIRHLPVVNKASELIGIFSVTDLNRAYTPHETEAGWYYDKEGLALLDVRHFMSKDPLTLTPGNTLKEAAELIVKMKYGCLPVVDHLSRKLVGIISYVDILREIAKHF